MKSFREVVQGVTLAALIASTTLFVLPHVLAPASQLDTTNEIAAPYGVSIVWTDDWRNCMARTRGGRAAACWSSITPNVIYVKRSGDALLEQFLVAHETAHVIQYRNSAKLDECEADTFALEKVPEISGLFLSVYKCGLPISAK